MISTNRKFKFTVAVFIVSSVALFADKLDGGEYVALITLLTGIYSGSNVAQKHVQRGGDGD